MILTRVIPSITLSNGYQMPRLSYGTGTSWYFGYDNNVSTTPKTSPELAKLVEEALRKGFYHIDCAETYGTELDVGEGIANFMKTSGVPRSELFVTSKVYNNVDNVTIGLQNILKRLRLDYLDLYLIHSPFSVKDFQKTWAEMEKLVEAGLTKSIGVSNYRIADLEATLKSCKIKPVLNQIEYHPYLQQINLIKYCKEHGIAVTSYSGLVPLVHMKDGPITPIVSELAKKYNQTEESILLQWNLSSMDLAVTTSKKPERLDGFLKVFSWNLEKEDIKKIDEAGAKIHFRKYWDKEFAEDDKNA